MIYLDQGYAGERAAQAARAEYIELCVVKAMEKCNPWASDGAPKKKTPLDHSARYRFRDKMTVKNKRHRYLVERRCLQLVATEFV